MSFFNRSSFWQFFSIVNYDVTCPGWATRVAISIHKPRPVIRNWQDAESEGSLKTYFDGHDFLGVVDVPREEQCLYEYSGDYGDYIKTRYSRDDIVAMYRRYLRNNAYTVPTWANEYDSELTFSKYFERQIGQYIDVISNIPLNIPLYIVGDGPGTASIAASMTGHKYYSFEPNSIGDKAVSLGIISSKQPREALSEEVVLLFNVLEHVSWKIYKNNNVICIEGGLEVPPFSVDKDVRTRVIETGGARVFAWGNIGDIRLKTYKFENPKYMFMSDSNIRSAVATDNKSRYVMRIATIPEGVGEKVTTDVDSPYLNLLTRNRPTVMRTNKKNTKIVNSVPVVVYPGINYVYTYESLLKVVVNRYDSMFRTDVYVFHEGHYFIKAQRPERLEGVYNEAGDFIKLFLKYKFTTKRGTTYGVFVSAVCEDATTHTVRDVSMADFVPDYILSFQKEAQELERTLDDY